MISNTNEFYTSLFDLYKNKIELLICHHMSTFGRILFNKFVLSFVNLAMYDASEVNFSNTLAMFKTILEESTDIDERVIHVKFLSKYSKYLYEDAFENLEKYRLNYKKESIIKRQFSKVFIEQFRRVLLDTENNVSVYIDDIVIGMTCLYVFRSSIMDNDDAALICSMHRYENIDN